MSNRSKDGRYIEDPVVARACVKHLEGLGYAIEGPERVCATCQGTGMALVPSSGVGSFYGPLACPSCGAVAESNRKGWERGKRWRERVHADVWPISLPGIWFEVPR